MPPPTSPTKSRSPPVLSPGIPVNSNHFASKGGPPVFSRPKGAPPVMAPTLLSQTGQGSKHRPASMQPQQQGARGAPAPVAAYGGHHAGSRSVDSGRGGGGPANQVGEGGKETVDRDFEQMMADLEVPSGVRDKMNTMETHVKSAFLKNSQSFQALTNTGGSRPGLPSHLLRPSKSASGTPPPHHHHDISSPITSSSPSGTGLPPSLGSGAPGMAPSSSRPGLINAGLPAPATRSHLTASTQDNNAPVQSSGGGGLFGTSGKKNTAGKKAGKGVKDAALDKGADGPVAMARWLKEGPRAEIMDLARVKKLRMLLRHESTMWVEVFIQERGYVHLLKKLSEVVEMEWREEQHDDQLLYELLRCVKALSTSLLGSAAIRSCSPNPFVPLTALLFTDKKPGDVPTRQIMTELILLLFDLYPSSPPAPRWPGDKPSGREYEFALPREYATLPGMVRELLIGEQKENEVVEFVSVARRPRIFKTYLTEISDICRDYFWMFCHANGIWKLDETDVSLLERPTAPGGATGGVEYEAVNYLTVHFRLINSLARSCADHREPIESDTSAWRFHAQLFESGFDKILLSARKASTTYYPHLHLELSRYISLARQAQYDLPYPVARLIEPPPAHLRMINGQESVGLPSQGLNGGRILGAPSPEKKKASTAGGGGSPRLESGAAPRGGGERVAANKIDERFVFQAPRGREVSPAPQVQLARKASAIGLEVPWN